SDFNRALELDLESSLPIFYRGVALVKKGQDQKALNDFNIVLDTYPENEVVLFNRAMLYSDMKKNAAALEDYNEVVRLNPKSILARFNRGLLHLSEKRLSKALEDLNQALELFPEFLDAHEVRLQLLEQLGRRTEYEAAEKTYNEVRSFIATSADDVKEEQHIRLMKLTKLKGDFERMEQEVGKIQHQKVDVRLLPFYRVSPNPETDKDISVYDGFGRPFYNIGVITFTTKTNAYSAMDARMLVSILELDKSPSTTDFIRSIPYYVYAGAFEKAYARLDDCIADNVSETACYFSRAYVRQVELQQFQKEHFELVGSLDVVDTNYDKRVDEMIALIEADYRKVIELDKHMSFAHFNLAHLLASAERYVQAENHFGLAASSRGNFIEANYNRGLIRLILGKTALACEDLSLAGELGYTEAYSVIRQYCE
ncbi:MAG: tetratricopeptide repeat protein, partial [Flavobacteriales bacterium]|nr:tetratricopeptide repeat protein [Flavobacteriales bacterium]